ncbi:PQ-loop repeat-containing protein 1-like isoform X3 [Varroa jacobsoni]|uniref:PQ-loop repeat-containing protein 1-like isoform X3 n=1 Tax=Varroa jacobsoni TaxID=62625 RepID=UPI000BF314A1|nr:PQ-loop repeat-containing protein 1-like isoform X3 [Varroa jacobsoni]XP_022698458.1 PQ-loop repeat-containing protein 1-like isoform X3 [Varroa jacobsoni]XP_022698460.1 PQ-loop repeat-containing protein 1-like isoform X3 [Varroa jacobsoni]XP_022698461.1 PQ-loop repeat-containing protein 1-like isoform X3 [Varroa jacobsoni]
MATSIVVGQFANLSWFRSFHDVRWCFALRASVRIAFAISANFCGIYWYREILRTKNADGFSTFVCLALLVANILRIFFWFCVRFETPLLIQSIIMTTAMLLMIHLCIRTRREQLITPPPKTKTFHDLEWRHFWQWTDFLSYVECTIIFTIIAGSVVFLFKDVTVVVEFVGLVAVLTEALLGMPQFYKNFVNKSTAGMSTSMVMLWLFGDVFKTAYFVLRDSPVQFVLCGILQVSIDLAILSQLWLYRHRRPVRKSSKMARVTLMADPRCS